MLGPLQPKIRGSLRRILFGGSLSPAVTQESWTQKQVAHGRGPPKDKALGDAEVGLGGVFINFGFQMRGSLHLAVPLKEDQDGTQPPSVSTVGDDQRHCHVESSTGLT